MFSGLALLAHGIRVSDEALLHGLQDVLILPAGDASLLASGTASLELLPVLLVRVVVLDFLASRTAIDIVVAKIDKVLLAESQRCSALGRVLIKPGPMSALLRKRPNCRAAVK